MQSFMAHGGTQGYEKATADPSSLGLVGMTALVFGLTAPVRLFRERLAQLVGADLQLRIAFRALRVVAVGADDIANQVKAE